MAADILHFHAPAAYFGFAVLGSGLLAWLLGLATRQTSLMQAMARSASTMGVIILSFLLVAVIAVSAPSDAARTGAVVADTQ